MRRFHVVVNGLSYEVEVEEIGAQDEAPATATAGASTQEAPAAPAKTAAQQSEKEPARPAPPERRPVAAPAVGLTAVTAPLPGAVLDVKVAVGDVVKEGDVLAILEAMKMENEILAPCSGRVAAVRVAPGAAVDGGEVLIELT